jgi:hypothetical protein
MKAEKLREVWEAIEAARAIYRRYIALAERPKGKAEKT